MNKKIMKTGGVVLSYFLKSLMIILLIISILNRHIEWIFGTSLGIIVSLVPTILKRNYQVIYILDEYWDGLMMDKYAMAFVVVFATIAMGVIWEMNEWITDIIFGTQEQWGYNDTIKDLFIDMVAGIIMALIGVTMIKRGSFDELTEDLGEQIDKKIIKKRMRNKDG